MHVDRSMLIDTAWAFTAIIIIAIGGNFEGDLRLFIQGTGFAVLFAGVLIQTWLFQLMTQSYQYIRAELLPSKKILHLFVKRMTSKRTTKHNWSTEMELNWPVKHPYYGKLDRIIVHHKFPREKRFNFDHGICMFHGYEVDHPRVEHVILYEYPRGSYDLDHSNPVPTFKLKLASNDYFLPAVKEQSNPGVLKVAQLEHSLNERTREAMDYKQKFIREEERSKHIQNELSGILKGEMDFDSAVTERMLAIRRQQLRIENAIRNRTPSISLGMAVVALIAIIIATFVIVVNPNNVVTGLGDWITMNPALTGIFALMACLLIYFVIRRGRY